MRYNDNRQERSINKGERNMKMLLTNNDRRFAGLAPHRKGNKGRDKNMEVIGAFLDYCEGTQIGGKKR